MADDDKPDTPRNGGDYGAPHMSRVTPANQARAQATRVAASVVAQGALYAAWFGGRMAAVEPTVTGSSHMATHMATSSMGHQGATRTTVIAAEAARQGSIDTVARR